MVTVAFAATLLPAGGTWAVAYPGGYSPEGANSRFTLKPCPVSVDCAKADGIPTTFNRAFGFGDGIPFDAPELGFSNDAAVRKGTTGVPFNAAAL